MSEEKKKTTLLCPLCSKELKPSRGEGGLKYYCDCVGQMRSVIEVLPEEQKGVENGSAN